MAISFRARLLLIFISLLGVVMLTSTVAVLRAVDQTAISNAERELLVAERVFDQLLEDNTRQLRDRTALLAEDFGFRQAIATDEEDTIVSALVNHGDRIAADLIMMVSPLGEVRISTHQLGNTAAYLAEQVETSREPFSALVIAEQVPFQLVMVPVRAPELIAWVGVGFEMDSALVTNFRDITNTDVTLLFRADNQSPPQTLTTLSDLGISATDNINDDRLNDYVAAYNSDLEQNEWLSREKTLLEREQQQITLMLSVSLIDAQAVYNDLQAQMLTWSLIVLAIAVVVSVFIANSITRPIGVLVKAAKCIAQGDYNKALVFPGSTEFSVLGDTLTQMQTDIRIREARIRFQADFDAVMGIPNRHRMASLYEHQLADVKNASFFTVLVKITNYETLSDVYGVSVMDPILKAASDRLLHRLNLVDNFGTVKNDELMLFADLPDNKAVVEFTDKLHDIFRQPFRLEQIELSLVISIGVVNCPLYAAKFEDAFRRSHIALTEARLLNARYYCYEKGLENSYLRKLEVTHQLQNAIQNSGFTLMFQPQYDLTQGRIHSAEALIRWHDDVLGPMYPDEFIPIAESSGDITLITDWVFRESLKQLARWKAAGFELSVSINLSAKDVLRDDFIDRVIETIESEQVHPKSLMLEVTESSFVEDTKKAIKNLTRLYDVGVYLAMDDFGTGFSSLGQLKVMPVHELKIDKSFVLNLDQDEDDQNIVRSTIEMAHHLGLSVIAEGVENKASLEILRDFNCDAIQGYYLSRPIKADELTDWLTAFNSKQLDSAHV